MMGPQGPTGATGPCSYPTDAQLVCSNPNDVSAVKDALADTSSFPGNTGLQTAFDCIACKIISRREPVIRKEHLGILQPFERQ